MADVFISYKSERRPAARHLASILELNGFSVWYDYGLLPGEDFENRLMAEIAEATVVVALWCEMSVASEWVLKEASEAKRDGKLLPCWIQRVGPPGDFARDDIIDLTSWDGAPRSHALDRLLDDVGRRLGRDPAPRFRGLRDLDETWRAFGAPSLAQFALSERLKPQEEPEAAPSGAQPAHGAPPRLEDLRRTWDGLDKENTPLVERFLERVRAAAPGSGLEFEVEHQLDLLEKAAAQRTAEEAARAKAEAEARTKVEAARAEFDRRFPPLAVFRDALRSGGQGPEMVVIPEGAFLMGSPEDEPERSPAEGPQHRVLIGARFGLGKYAVTFDEYDAFCAASGASKPEDQGWGRGRRPVVNVSWEDATAFCRWLSEETGAGYRLPSEAEWEYACRAGTTTPFWWGSAITPDRANYDGAYVYAGGGAKGTYRGKTEPVDAFEANPWGLFQTHGNVSEWCQDAWNDDYKGAPTDGSAWMKGDRSRAVLRGGSWSGSPIGLRSANRLRVQRGLRYWSIGFRVARTIIGP